MVVQSLAQERTLHPRSSFDDGSGSVGTATADNSSMPMPDQPSEPHSMPQPQSPPPPPPPQQPQQQSQQQQGDQEQQPYNEFMAGILQMQAQFQDQYRVLTAEFLNKLEPIAQLDMETDRQVEAAYEDQRQLEERSTAESAQISEGWSKVCTIIDPLTAQMTPNQSRAGGTYS